MRKQGAGDIRVNELIDAGWSVCRSATVNRYKPAGSISEMKSRNGLDFVRVHHGKCVSIHNYQITTVLFRPQKTGY